EGRVMLLNRNSLILTLMSAAGGMIIYCSGHVPDLSPRTPGAYWPGVAGTAMSMYGFGALVSISGGWVGGRVSPRIVMGAMFIFAQCLVTCYSMGLRFRAALGPDGTPFAWTTRVIGVDENYPRDQPTERSSLMEHKKYIGMDVHQATISLAVMD